MTFTEKEIINKRRIFLMEVNQILQKRLEVI